MILWKYDTSQLSKAPPTISTSHNETHWFNLFVVEFILSFWKSSLTHHRLHVFIEPFPNEHKEICSQAKVRTKAACLLDFARNCDFLRPLWVWHCLAFLKSVSQSWRRSASWLGKICIVRTIHAPVSPSTSHFLLPLAQEMPCCFPSLLVQHSGHKFNFPALLFQKATFLPH